MAVLKNIAPHTRKNINQNQKFSAEVKENARAERDVIEKMDEQEEI